MRISTKVKFYFSFLLIGIQINIYSLPVLANSQKILQNVVSETNILNGFGRKKSVDKDLVDSTKLTTELTNIERNIKTVSENITVRIDSQNSGNGSGIIFAHQNGTYYVLTSKHVVRDQDSYYIITPDEKSHLVEYKSIEKIEDKNTDLAILSFKSDSQYQIAKFATYDELEYHKSVDSYLEEKYGLSFIEITLLSPIQREKLIPALAQQRQDFINLTLIRPLVFLYGWNKNKPHFTTGKLVSNPTWSTITKISFSFRNRLISEGYDTIYTNPAYAGMSGGSLLDADGRVIAIHSSIEGDSLPSGSYSVGYSHGISSEKIIEYLSSMEKYSQIIKVENNPPQIISIDEMSKIFNNISSIEKEFDISELTDWIEYGNQLSRDYHYEDAITAFQTVINKNPEHPKIYYAYYGLGNAQFGLAKLHFAKGVDSILRIGIVSTEENTQTRILFYRNKLEESLKSFEKVLELNPNFAPAIRQYADIQGMFRTMNFVSQLNLNTSISEEDKDNLMYDLRNQTILDAKKSLDSLNLAIENNPDDDNLHKLRGEKASFLHLCAEAIKSYQRAIEINPSYDEYYFRVLSLYLGLHKYKEADKFYLENEEAISRYINSNQLSPTIYQEMKIAQQKRNNIATINNCTACCSNPLIQVSYE